MKGKEIEGLEDLELAGLPSICDPYSWYKDEEGDVYTLSQISSLFK